MQKAYYAIIPANVRYDEELTPNAKLLYGEITALCNEKGFCWATNSYFSELYGKSNETISRWISSLKERDLIAVSITYRPGTKEIEKRVITLLTKTSIPSPQKRQYPIDENVKDNTTVNNTYTHIGESEFLQIWERARKHYDKKETNISRLNIHERSNFDQLSKNYNKKQFEQAVAGLFYQKTVPAIRVRPTHFLQLDRFETYLDCWLNNIKLFEDDKKKPPKNTGML